jgi:heat shock protein HslJ
MRKLLLITMILAVAGIASACSPGAQQKIREGLQTAAPTIQAAAQSAGTQVAAGIQTAGPTLEAAARSAGTQVAAGIQTAAPTLEAAAQAAAQSAGTQVAAGVQTAAPTLVAAAGELGATINKVTALANTWEWQGTKLSDGTERTPADPTAYTVNFMVRGKLAIKADCNTATGTYAIDGESLTITPGATTLAVCPEGSFSDAFLKDLGEVGGATMDGGNLVLMLKMDSGTMTFAPAK